MGVTFVLCLQWLIFLSNILSILTFLPSQVLLLNCNISFFKSVIAAVTALPGVVDLGSSGQWSWKISEPFCKLKFTHKDTESPDLKGCDTHRWKRTPKHEKIQNTSLSSLQPSEVGGKSCEGKNTSVKVIWEKKSKVSFYFCSQHSFLCKIKCKKISCFPLHAFHFTVDDI